MVPEKIKFREDDRIAVIAPHPDDECLGASSVLLLAPDRTDIFVLTDGSHGSRTRSIPEEAHVRKRQLEAEMDLVRPRAWYWFGYEDTRLADYPEAAQRIDFRPYTKIFLPQADSLHPDHRAAAAMCHAEILAQKAAAECFAYEIFAPFHSPSHYADLTALIDRKLALVRCHADQIRHEEMITALNRFRGAQLARYDSACRYAEAFLAVRPAEDAQHA